MPARDTRPFGFGRNRATPLPDLIAFAAIVALFAWTLYAGSSELGYHWQWYRVPRYLFRLRDGAFVPGPLLLGLWVTVKLTLAGLVCSLAVGLTATLMRLSGSPVARLFSRTYLELVRNTPLLIQIFFIYFVLAPILDIGRFTAAVAALSLFEGAYASEIIRSGIVSIAKGQWEAAHSLGLSRTQAYVRVILPQAVRRILPPLTSQSVALIKDSALVSTIAVFELTMQGQQVIADTFLTFEIWFTVAAIYLLLTVSLTLLSGKLETRLRLEDA